MRQIVLDTNSLIQSLPARSPYHKIWTDYLSGQLVFCVTTSILNEYEEILTRLVGKNGSDGCNQRIVEQFEYADD